MAKRAEEPLWNAILKSRNATSFEDGWKCIGSGRFGDSKVFCGSLATVYPGTATVESDFSVVNFEKNQYRNRIIELSLEGILHAKQYTTISSFNTRL